MKITQFTPTYFSDNSVIGGGEKYPQYVKKALCLVPGISDQDVGLISFGKENKDLLDIDVKLIAGNQSNRAECDWTALRNALNCTDCLIVHQCLSEIGLCVAAQARLSGVRKVIGFDHGSGVYFRLNKDRRLCQVYSCLIAQSKFAEKFLMNYGVPYVYAPGPIDDIFFRCPSPFLCEQVHAPFALTVGRILPHKGYEDAIKACGKSLDYIICGSRYDHDYTSYLEEVAQKHGTNVLVKEGLSNHEVRHLMSIASVYIHPSKHVDYKGNYHEKPELLGLAPLEALCCGTPVLVGCGGALPELSTIEGCESYSSTNELESRLSNYLDKRPSMQQRKKIANSASRGYGLLQFSKELIRAITTGSCD
jgi:glycosyltransferase involved in cell wall biosynthesis